MKRALSGGVEVAYDDAGRGEPAIILIHAPFGRRSHFVAQFDHLAKRRRVIALDLRGCGESGAPSDGFRIIDFAEDVRAVAHAAGVTRAVLCGHRLGGTIALEVAVLDPPLVAGVVLLDAVVLFPEPVRRQTSRGSASCAQTPSWQLSPPWSFPNTGRFLIR